MCSISVRSASASTWASGASCRQQAAHPFRQDTRRPAASASATAASTTRSATDRNIGSTTRQRVGPAGTATGIFSCQPPSVRVTVVVTMAAGTGVEAVPMDG